MSDAQDTIQAYGRSFPANMMAWRIELECYRYKLDTGLQPWEHLKNATQLLYPEEYRWSYWSDLIFRATCENDFLSIWGAGGTGKSTTCAIWDLMDWLADPKGTTTKIFTTSMGKQVLRHFGEVTRYHSMRPGVVHGEYVPSEAAIFYRDEHGIYPKATIIAQSVKQDAQGKVSEIGNFGVHNIRNRMVIDEANGTPAAALKSSVNQAQGGESFKVRLIGNPSHPEDLLCAHSLPITGTFDDLDPDTDVEWDTFKNGVKLGKCIHLDGLNSPRIKHPDGEKLYPFLLGQKGIDFCLAMEGKDSQAWWEQIRGFVTKTSRITDRIFDGQIIRGTDSRNRVVLIGEVIRLAGIDPAWSSGGDRCILKLARLGYAVDGRRVLIEDEKIHIKIKDSRTDPVSNQIARQAHEAMTQYRVPPTNVITDCTGTQHGVPDVLQLNYGWYPMRCSFGGGASERPISSFDPTPAREKYFNRVTEMWSRAADTMRYRGFYGLDDETIAELGSRRFIMQGKKQMAESKKEMKTRIGKSPDLADTTILLDTIAREMYGFCPEANIPTPKRFDWGEEEEQGEAASEETYDSEVML